MGHHNHIKTTQMLAQGNTRLHAQRKKKLNAIYQQDAYMLNILSCLDASLFVSLKDSTCQSRYGKAPCVLNSLEFGLSTTQQLVLQDHHTKQKTNSNKGLCKRREAAVAVSVAQSYLRVFFNPDTCKPFHHDLQWGKCRLGAGRPPKELFSQQMMRNTLLFLAGKAFVVCSPAYG